MHELEVKEPLEFFYRICQTLSGTGEDEYLKWSGTWELVNSRWNSYWHRVTYTHWAMREADWTRIIALIRRRPLETFVGQIWSRYIDESRLALVKEEIERRSKNRTSYVISYQFKNTSIVRKGCCLSSMHIVRRDGRRELEVHFDTSVQEVMGLMPGDLWLFHRVMTYLGLLPRNKQLVLGNVYHTNAKWFWYRDYTFALIPLMGWKNLSPAMKAEVKRCWAKGETHGLKRVRRYYRMTLDMRRELDEAGEDSIFSADSFCDRKKEHVPKA